MDSIMLARPLWLPSTRLYPPPQICRKLCGALTLEKLDGIHRAVSLGPGGRFLWVWVLQGVTLTT